MNPFQGDFHDRLRSWKNLRLLNQPLSLDKICINVDHWWQQAPLISYHIHPLDSDNWPDPWTILSENIYCKLTRALGICYTMLIMDIYNIHLYDATDSTCEDHYIVSIGSAKYTLNYNPDSVISTTLLDFNIKSEIDLAVLKSKI